jgi:hypothetical protein
VTIDETQSMIEEVEGVFTQVIEMLLKPGARGCGTGAYPRQVIAKSALRLAIDLFVEEHGEGPESEAKFKEFLAAEVTFGPGAGGDLTVTSRRRS